MIKPRTTLVLFIIVLIQVYLFLPWKGIFFTVISLLYLSYLVFNSVNICSQAYIKTICKAKTTDKKIAISFDDGPDTTITPKVLELLDQYNIKATFFCVGQQIEDNQNILKSIDEKGHLIGNHSWSHHTWFDFFSSKKMKVEIEKTSGLIFETINKKVKLFRPPYGVTNPSLRNAIKGKDFITIGWSIRSLDTIKSTEKTLSKLYKRTSAGYIILFHDNREHIIDILKSYLDFIKDNGYEVVPMDQLLNIKAYE